MKAYKYKYLYLIIFVFFLSACGNDENETTIAATFKFESITIDGKKDQSSYLNIAPNAVISIEFSEQIDQSTIESNIKLKDSNNKDITLTYNYSGDKTAIIKPAGDLKPYEDYELSIWSGLKSKSGKKILTGKSFAFSTSIDLSDKFARITDEELLTLVQKQTFKYFWNFGHPVSGMARERSMSGDIVTTGGTGFGVMSMIVAAEREFISRAEALTRIQKIVSFLDTKCISYHGAFAHWVNGSTGATQPFSTYDNGADLVETSLLFQGLLSARAYFKNETADEQKVRNDITRLWEAVEWTWFQKNSANVLNWHWSPDYGFQMNLTVSGWNECLITYVLSASSPTHAISKDVYDEGWTRNGSFRNGNTFYGYKLPLGPDYGGPLFLSQYSFLGINPKDLTDKYANYWEQNTNHSLVNYNYCVQNPKGYAGYGANCWGLTASDGDTGYSAYSPTNDKGVIAPTAALSAMPYTPDESIAALHFFYYKLGDKLWKDYGFNDSFNLSANWFDNQQIAINQGPIIIMIENYRSQLLWSLFMSDEEIKNGMKKLGFQSPNL